MKEIRFDKVSTKVAEETFSKIILQKLQNTEEDIFQTFFLNGVWGSGKTTFLKKVEGQAKSTKFIYLKLWEAHDERSVTAIAFSLLHPFLYYLLRFLIVIAVVTSVLMTPAINLGLLSYLKDLVIFLGLPIYFHNFLIILSTIIALIVTVYQLLKVKSDSMYICLLPKFLSNNKVLVIDDFDRITTDRQNEAYKLFNILHGKLPIIFVGDYQKIAKSDDESGKFLQKIIDRRLELPSALNSNNIWRDYLNKLDDELDISSGRHEPKIFSIIKSENRTLRELNQFSDLLNYELFKRGKRELVDVKQLITIDYIFLFYPKYYLELKDFGMLLLDEDIEEIRLVETMHSSQNRKKDIKEKFYEILIENEKVYPRHFIDNKGIYYVDEYIKNLSSEEAKEIFSNRNKLENIISRDNNNDFLAYLTVEYSKFRRPKMDDFRSKVNIERKEFEENRNLIEELVIREIKKGNKNQIIDFVVNELGKKIYLESKEKAEKTLEYQEIVENSGKSNNTQKDEIDKLINKIESDKWERYTYILSLSECIKFHVDYRFGGRYIIPLLTKESNEMLHNQEKLSSEKYKPYIYFLITRTFDGYKEKEDDVKHLIDELPDNEFIQYWELMGMIRGNTIYTNSLDFDTGNRKNYYEIYELNRERFESIADRKGIIFKVDTQTV
ncbi:KAP family atpases [Streptococcus gallolyticus]|uniref:KAP family atpases n=2 Tax=Streptococcus TaxID=1301 RepID=UPI000210B8AF|nr:KAP family atpases [Streptococcus gallolyticus]BAK27198.1 KAP family NTPases [Streptococcus gallolyticus subsp. gallolyticus ATCC 43143]